MLILRNSLFLKNMRKRGFSAFILKRYAGRLSVSFFFNLLSVMLSVLVFMMVEPLSKLILRGTLDDLSPVGTFFVSLLAHFVDVDTLSYSLLGVVIIFLILFIARNLLAYSAQWVMATVRSNLLFILRNALYMKIIRLPLGYFNRCSRGDIVSRAVNDVQDIEFTILNSLRQLMTEPITVLIYLATLFYISVRLTLCSLILFPVTFFLIGRLSASLRRSAGKSKRELGLLLSQVEESIAGLRIIKGFNAQRNAEQVFDRLNTDFARTQRKIYRKVDLASPLNEFLGVCVVMVVLVIGGFIVLSPGHALSAELFITYIAMFTQIINPLKNISTAFSNYRRGQASVDRVRRILEADSFVEQDANPVHVSGFRDAIRIEHLSFAYDTQEVLTDIDLTIHRGECVAIVGQSGAGKSTLTDLLERFYDPTAGRILIDGVDIRRYDLHDLRALYALVTQDVVLFNDSVFNNIAVGMPGATEEDVIEAAKIANIYDFIQTLPDGLRHNLGDRGLNLSGGQRQRISIARAVLRDAPILILDEATSAMDTESERAVQTALDNVMKNRTVIVISHRLSTVRHANCIYVLDGGHIAEHGTHDVLMAQDGLYCKLLSFNSPTDGKA